MAANYVDGRQRFGEPDVTRRMQADSLDETRPADVKTWFERQQDELALFTLRGELAGRPPTSLRYWVLERGYPVVCVINKNGSNADYNHAVVVVGLDGQAEAAPQTVHYLDPASLKRVEHCDPALFESYWSRCDHMMAVVVRRPAARRAVSSAE